MNKSLELLLEFASKQVTEITPVVKRKILRVSKSKEFNQYKERMDDLVCISEKDKLSRRDYQAIKDLYDEAPGFLREDLEEWIEEIEPVIYSLELVQRIVKNKEDINEDVLNEIGDNGVRAYMLSRTEMQYFKQHLLNLDSSLLNSDGKRLTANIIHRDQIRLV